MSPSEIKVAATPPQLREMLGALYEENQILKAIIAQHPEIVASHNVDAAPPVPAEAAPVDDGEPEE